MNFLKLSITILLIAVSNSISALYYNCSFTAQNDDGVTFYYRINSDTEMTVSVTYEFRSSTSGQYYYRSDAPTINIPKSVSYNGITYTVTSIETQAFQNCGAIENVIIPNTVTSIGNYAFSDCRNLKSIVIPNSVTAIGESAFSGCIELSNIILPNSLERINDNTFKDCSHLASIDIPCSVTSIGKSAFYECTNLSKVIIHDTDSWFRITFDSRESNPLHYAHHLYSDEDTEITELVIPEFVTSLDYNSAFMDCTGLTNVIIPNSVTSIGPNSFKGCTGLTNIDLPNSLTTINGESFSNCTGLTSIVIPNSVTYIGWRAFAGCTEIKSLVIPASVTSINDYAFAECDNLEIVYSLITKVFTISENIFSEMAFNNSTLYVPKGKKTTYKGTNYWKKFLNIMEGAPTEVDNLDRSYNLKVSEAGMATMYLDYPVAIPNNNNMLGVFYVESMADHILYMRRLNETIPANCGVIVMANPGTFTFKETLLSTDIVEQNLLSGTTVKVSTASIPGAVYTLGRGVNSGYMGFHKYTGATLPANKAYLVRDADEEEDDVLVIDRSAFDGLFDSTTGVTKVVIEGESQPIIYNLQGRRVENPSKGIYIVNGKKQYIK